MLLYDGCSLAINAKRIQHTGAYLMKTKTSNPYADTEFVRSYHANKANCEQEHDVVINTHICPARRPDRIVIRHEAYGALPSDSSDKPLCAYELDWPNAQVMSFSAALYRSVVTMERLVDDSRAELWAATLRAQGE